MLSIRFEYVFASSRSANDIPEVIQLNKDITRPSALNIFDDLCYRPPLTGADSGVTAGANDPVVRLRLVGHYFFSGHFRCLPKNS